MLTKPFSNLASVGCIFLSNLLFSLLLRLCATEKALQLPLFSSLSFSPQQIWTNWRKLLVKLSTFVKLDKCYLIQIHWRWLCEKYIMQFEILYVKLWYDMCFRENNDGGSKLAYKWACGRCQCFSWCKLSLIHDDQHLWKLFCTLIV